MGYPGEVCSRTGKSRGDGIPPGRSVQGQARAGVMRYHLGRSVQEKARAGLIGYPPVRFVPAQDTAGVMGYPRGDPVQGQERAWVMGYPGEICSRTCKSRGDAVTRRGLFKDRQKQG